MMKKDNIVAFYFNKQKKEGVQLLKDKNIEFFFNIEEIIEDNKKYKFELFNEFIILKCNKKEEIFLLLQKEDKELKNSIIKSFYNNGYSYLLDKNSLWYLNYSINSLNNQIIPKIETLIFSNMTFKEDISLNLLNLNNYIKKIEDYKEQNKLLVINEIKNYTNKTCKLITNVSQQEKEELLSFFETTSKKNIDSIKELHNETKKSIKNYLEETKVSNKEQAETLKKIDFSNVVFMIHHGKTKFVLFGEVETKDDVAFISVKKRSLELETTNKNILKYSNNKDLFFYLSDNFDVEFLKEYLPDKTFKEVKKIYKNTFSKKIEILITIMFIISLFLPFFTNYKRDITTFSSNTPKENSINMGNNDSNISVNKLLKSLGK